MAEPLPCVLVAGYLGAGKTTLVNHLLRHAGGRRIAVLVNDFGRISIDADLIESRDEAVLSLAGGCLCCSFGDDLVGSLNALARREPRPDLVLIELSGVALPAAVARSIALAAGVQWSATLALADAAEIRRQAGDPYVGDTVRQQLREADWIVVNKGDLTSAETLQALPGWLAELAPRARVVVCAAAALAPELVFGWRAAPPAASDDEARFAPRAIGRPPNPAAALFASRSATLLPGTALDELAERLADPASGVLRAKGFVHDAGGHPRLLQVAGRRWRVEAAAFDGPDRLVLIGLREFIEAPGWTIAGLRCDDAEA